MKNFKYRIWDGIKKEMIDPNKIISHNYCTSIYGEVFRNCEGPVEKCEILPWTGVKDIDGVEIYEGDILQDNQGTRQLVRYSCGCFNLGRNGDIVCKSNVKLWKLKVVGNKFERRKE